MGELSGSAEEHLLSVRDPAAPDQLGRISAASLFVKWVLEPVMGLIFAAWVALIVFYPTEAVIDFIHGAAAVKNVFGQTGGYFLLYSGPILLITFLSIARFIILDSREEELLLKNKSGKSPRLRLWTFPVLVDGPFGVVSAAEFIGICFVVVYLIWTAVAYTMEDITLMESMSLPNFREKSEEMLELTGLRFGVTGLFFLTFMFLPVARGSVLLRLINIPFEQAVRYHVWLGHLTMAFFTLHGLCYVVYWAMQGRLRLEIFSWSATDTVADAANFAGVISLLAGLLMWVTSLPPVRKKQFEVFFYTHQLYVVFVVFLALHIGDYFFSIAAGAIFLFMLDRFLRFCQSRRNVDVISVTSLPSGAIELVLYKPRNLQYNALSFVFVQIRELSWLQWHPFSVSSSPLDGGNKLAVIIKVLGDWSQKLNRHMISVSEPHCQNGRASEPPKITASVEGPYGHNLPYHLTYENLVLVAGGIGITPFLAILSDILLRVREGKPCLPSNVLLVWAIKNSDELPLLSCLAMESLAPLSPSKIDLKIDIYVTRESGPPLEEGNVENGQKAENLHVCPVSSGCGMSVLVGTGNNIWSGLYLMCPAVGFIALLALLDIFYIDRTYSTLWYKGILFLMCMVASVIVFGGLVVFLWHFWEQKMVAIEKSNPSNQNLQTAPVTDGDTPRIESIASKKVIYGSRPNFQEIFGSVGEQWGHVDVGVIVCGPPTLETSVARECRSRSLKRGSGSPIFHFNSHTFDI